MKKSRLAAIFLPLLASLMPLSCRPSGGYVTISGYAQGGTYMIKVNTDGAKPAPEDMKTAIDSILNAFDNSLSGYNRNSILTRFNAGETVVPDSTFIEMYRLAVDFWKTTGGALDVSAAPLFDIWGFGFTSDSLPSPSLVEEVRKTVGMERLVPDLADAVAPDGTLRGADVVADGDLEHLPRLNYNAIAQGYACDLVASYLEGAGVKDMLVNIGGEIVCSGVNPAGAAWTIGVDRPVDGNNVSGADLKGVMEAGPERCGVVTSGNYRKFYVKDGKKYAHTVDPRTGWPVQHSLLSATIVAPDAVTADAFATYCMVLGLDGAVKFIEGRPDLEAYLIYEDSEGVMHAWHSSGFRLVKE